MEGKCFFAMLYNIAILITLVWNTIIARTFDAGEKVSVRFLIFWPS
jgi:hypothetical protein